MPLLGAFLVAPAVVGAAPRRKYPAIQEEVGALTEHFVANRPEQLLPYAALAQWSTARRLWQDQAVLSDPFQDLAHAGPPARGGERTPELADRPAPRVAVAVPVAVPVAQAAQAAQAAPGRDPVEPPAMSSTGHTMLPHYADMLRRSGIELTPDDPGGHAKALLAGRGFPARGARPTGPTAAGVRQRGCGSPVSRRTPRALRGRHSPTWLRHDWLSSGSPRERLFAIGRFRSRRMRKSARKGHHGRRTTYDPPPGTRKPCRTGNPAQPAKAAEQ